MMIIAIVILFLYSITRIYATRLKENSAICKRFGGSRPRAFFVSLVKTRLKATRVYANSLICKYFYGPTRPFNSLKCNQIFILHGKIYDTDVILCCVR